MNKLQLKVLDYPYIEQLYQFEKENKAFFEQTCLPRPDAYNALATFTPIVEGHIAENEQGSHLMFLVFQGEELIGRVNITDFEVEPEHGLTALIGYRFGAKFCGKGYATQALKQVKHYLKKNGLCDRLYAGTAIDNYGSQIVLIKNHFQVLERVENTGGAYGPGDTYVEFGCTL